MWAVWTCGWAFGDRESLVLLASRMGPQRLLASIVVPFSAIPKGPPLPDSWGGDMHVDRTVHGEVGGHKSLGCP